jgi:hypothetical protein
MRLQAGVAELHHHLLRSLRRQKFTGHINRALTSTLGLQIVSSRSSGLSKYWFDRLLHYRHLFDLVAEVEGDVVECGVGQGQSLAMLASLVRSDRTQRHIWGFDSWEGLPAPSREDDPGRSSAVEGLWAYATPEAVLSTLRKYGFDAAWIREHVTLRRGLFAETMPGYDGAGIALLHIDAEIYNSYLDALRHAWPRLRPGGVAAFDEYHNPEFPGARRAVDDFLAGLPHGSFELRRDPRCDHYYVVRCW